MAQGTISNPNQSVTLYEFDNLGRRVKEIAAPVSVFGAGAPGTRDLETEYRYDASGRLTRRIYANRQSTWHVYDAAGQETHTIGALGDVTENRYDAAGRVVFTHRYLDRMPAATIAGFGDVVEAPIAPTSSLNDRRSHVVYDGDGQQRFTLNAAGASGWSVAERRYDPGGNVVEARAYAKSLPESAIAAFSSDASAAITPAEIEEQLRSAVGYDDYDPGTLAGVPRTFFAHDGVDRLRFTVDAMGSVTEDVRYAAGNVVATIRYAARPALCEYSETAIDAAVDRSDAGNRVSRYAFDAAGRLRYTVDTLN